MAGVTIIVDGRPIAWQRAAPVMVAELPIMKTPKKTRSYQELVRQLGKIAMGPRAPLLGPLELLVIATIERPKTVERRRPWCMAPATSTTIARAHRTRSMASPSMMTRRYASSGASSAIATAARAPNLRIEIYQLDVEDDECRTTLSLCRDHHHRRLRLRRRRDHHRRL